MVNHDSLHANNVPISHENNSEPLFATVSDIVEFLVVHPNDVMSVDLNNVLQHPATFSDEKSSYSEITSPNSIANNSILLVKENEETVILDDCEDDATEEAVKEDSDETAFLEKYDVVEDIIELPEKGTNNCPPAEAREEIENVEVLFECSLCSKIFSSEDEYLVHNCPNEGTPSFKPSKDHECELCNRSFRSYFVYQMHMSQHKNVNVCHLCNASFIDYKSLINHICEDHPHLSADIVNLEEKNVSEDKKQCDICGKITNNLKQHKMYHTIKDLEYCKMEKKQSLKKWFLCTKCNKKIFTEANYLFHLAQHDGEDFVRCKYCDFIATNVQSYNMHITTHTGSKYFICNDCGKCFFTRSAISDHVLIHMEGSRYMCEICGKRFKTSRSNAQHKLLQHKKYFRCARCNRGFTYEAKLNSHYNICQVIHQESSQSSVFEPVEKFFCNICNTNIKSSSEISILFHKAKHEGKEGVECRYCNLLCKNACIYKNHLLIHTNQRPYPCTQCSKSFRTKGCLVQHMLVHGDEYKYTCEYCGKKSKKLTTHVNHVNIHTDTKPYKCPDCARPFRQLSDMKKHRRTHLKYKVVEITSPDYGLTIKTEMEDIMAVDSIQPLQLV